MTRLAAVLLALAACAPASANPFTHCSGHPARPDLMNGPLQPHLEGDPIFFMETHQVFPKSPQFSEHKVWTNAIPWCFRADCEGYIKTLPEVHKDTMEFTRTCAQF